MEPVNEELRILVVEDSEDLVALWRLLFRHAGLSARFAHSGASALALIEDGYRPRVVVTDYYLPDTTGLEIVDGVRALGVDAHCLMITGNTDDEFAETARKKGICILYKPARFEEIEATIRSMVGASSSG